MWSSLCSRHTAVPSFVPLHIFCSLEPNRSTIWIVNVKFMITIWIEDYSFPFPELVFWEIEKRMGDWAAKHHHHYPLRRHWRKGSPLPLFVCPKGWLIHFDPLLEVLKRQRTQSARCAIWSSTLLDETIARQIICAPLTQHNIKLGIR